MSEIGMTVVVNHCTVYSIVNLEYTNDIIMCLAAGIKGSVPYPLGVEGG